MNAPSDPGASGRLKLLRESQHDTDRPGPIRDEHPQDTGELALQKLQRAEARRMSVEAHLALEIDRIGDAAQVVSATSERLSKSIDRLEETVSSMQGERLDVHKRLEEHGELLKKQGQFKYWLVIALTAAEAFRESGAAKVIVGILKALGQ